MGQDLGKTSRLLSIRRKGGKRGLDTKSDLGSSTVACLGGIFLGGMFRRHFIWNMNMVKPESNPEIVSAIFLAYYDNSKHFPLPQQLQYCTLGSTFVFCLDSSLYANHIFNVFDHDRDGKVSFEDFVTGLSLSLYGSREEKMRWAFQLYDLDGDGYITREEMATVVHSVHCMMGIDTLPTGAEMGVDEQVERLFMLMDKNQDGVISEEEFLDGCEKDESIKQSLAMFDSVS
ncbi:calsenilin-like [Stylophora pistillata]|uniref:calsenilin-like n=1 Tax=Stylophora pistillata TaxID=50429 RepID=UPI000C04B950|nr:calsenilin-like [Stylophora pistillata]